MLLVVKYLDEKIIVLETATEVQHSPATEKINQRAVLFVLYVARWSATLFA